MNRPGGDMSGAAMTNDEERGCAAAFFPGEIVGDCVLQKAHRIRDGRQEIWFAFDRKRNAPVVLKFIRDDHRNAAMAPALAEFLTHAQCRPLIRVLGTCHAGRFFAAPELWDLIRSSSSGDKSGSTVVFSGCFF